MMRGAPRENKMPSEKSENIRIVSAHIAGIVLASYHQNGGIFDASEIARDSLEVACALDKELEALFFSLNEIKGH